VKTKSAASEEECREIMLQLLETDDPSMYRRKMIGYEEHIKTNLKTVVKLLRKQRTPSEDAFKPRLVSPKSMYADITARYKSIDISQKSRDAITLRSNQEAA
jgi:hypothetical protein